jgi:simple sugar transport system permease protein
VKWDYGSSYVMIAILIVVAAGVRPAGGYGRLICVVLSATALQLLSSMFNFLDVSNFFRDCAWGLMLLLFLAVSRFDARAWWRAQFAAK